MFLEKHPSLLQQPGNNCACTAVYVRADGHDRVYREAMYGEEATYPGMVGRHIQEGYPPWYLAL